MPTGPGALPPPDPPPDFPDNYSNLDAINGDNVITTNESSVIVSGISDGIGDGAKIVTYLVPYADYGTAEPGIVAQSSTVAVTDLGTTDANGNEIGTYSAVLPTTGLAPGIYVAVSDIELPNGSGIVYENSGAGSEQVVSVKPPSTQILPAQIELSGTNAEITTDGKFVVYTAISEYNEPEITGHIYERNLQTGAEVDLTATGQSPTGVFAVNHTPTSYGFNGVISYPIYPSFASANGAETFSTITDFDLNPDGGGYNPLPVVTNAAGQQSVIGGIGVPKFDVGAATAVSDDGSVVLSQEVNEVQYSATGASTLEMADPQFYVTFLGTQTVAGLDVFNDISETTSGPLADQFLWSNAANWSNGIPASGSSATLSGPLGVDDIASLSLSSLDTGRQGAYVTGGLLTVNTVTIGTDSIFEADTERAGSAAAITVTIGTIASGPAIFWANGADASLKVTDAITQAEEYFASDGGRVILDNLAPGAGFEFREGIGTLALTAPGTTISGSVGTIAPGDVLELPGNAVSDINFGNTLDSVTTLSVITSNGVYIFTEASYEGVHGYIAAPDASTGLEAITFTAASTAPAAPDIFSDNATASSGQFLWSNAANWSDGIPTGDGAASLEGSGFDDIAALSLSTLISNGKVTSVDGAALDVSNFVADSASALVANSTIAGGSSTVSVLLGTVTGSGGLFVADGAHASIEILAGEPDEIYQAEAGGRIILDSLSSGSAFGFIGAGTLALTSPGASSGASIQNLSVGDVLELPDSTVESVSFGAHSLDIVTSTGTYDFTNVTFGSGDLDYAAAADAATGLEAITLTPAPQDVFQTKDLNRDAPPPYNGQYLWSDSANWTDGAVPQNGDDVTDNAQQNLADINVSLATLTLGAGAEVRAVQNLAVTTLVNGGDLVAQGNFSFIDGFYPATITVDSIIDSQDVGLVGADGLGGVAIINAPMLSSSFFYADGDGLLELYGAAGAGQLSFSDPLFSYFNGGGTIALAHPGANIGAKLRYVRPGDVLELPGMSVSSVHIGTASLTIATSAGTYTFADFETLQPVTGYTAAIDPGTGLEAITFTGPANPGVDVFSSNYEQGAPGQIGELWNYDGNWSKLVPRNGAAVELEYETGTVSIDNIDNLSLSSMAVDSSFQLLVAGTLAVGTLNIASGGDVDTQSPFTITGNVVNNGMLRSDDSILIGGSVAGGGTIDIAAMVGIHGNVAASETLLFDAENPTGYPTLALYNPGPTIAAAIEGLGQNEVIELPGTAVANIGFGPGEFDVTTSSGVYDFSNVTFGNSVGGYTSALDPCTGLEAITFNGGPPLDQFQDKSLYNAAEPLNGVYLWTDAANWVAGAVPVNGDDVLDSAAYGVDDVYGLSLESLTLANGSAVDVIGGNLTLANILNDGLLIAEGNVLGADTVFINGVINGGSSSLYIADGQGGVMIDNAPINAGVLIADGGGMLEINSAPGGAALNYNSSFFGYYNGPGTFALSHPGATIASAFENVEREDVVELPGTSVSAVLFGADSLTITTNAGTYDFTNVIYDGNVTGHTASFDSGTGLEAITFTGAPNVKVDVFEGTTDHADYPSFTGELWSTDANWESGVPRNGDAVEISTTGYINLDGQSYPDPSVDDIIGLSLSSMKVDAGTNLQIAEALTVGTLNVATGVNFNDQSIVTVTGTTLNDGVISTDPSSLILKGAVFGTGTIDIGAGSNVVVDAAVAAGETFDFTDSTGTLTINDATDFSGKILGSGDIIGGGSVADVFSPNSADGSGNYLWSNAANWSRGVPASGAAIVETASGTDDLANFSLSSLTLTRPAGSGADTQLFIDSALSIAQLTIGTGAQIDAFNSGGTVSIGSISIVVTNDGGLPVLYADAPGTVIDDNSANDPQFEYIAQNGGRVEIAGTPNATGFLTYGGGGTFALPAAGTLISATLAHIDTGDVLELPTTMVENIVFGTSSLTISTDSGTFTFSHVSYDSGVNGYTTGRDPATGLEAITFTGPDVFSENVATNGQYFWSNAANWSQGVPINGDSVTENASGIDDLSNLSLAALTLTRPTSSGIDTQLLAQSGLSIAKLLISNGAEIDAFTSNVTVSIGSITTVTINDGGLPLLYADAPGAVIDVSSASGPQLEYIAQNGGRVDIGGTPNATAYLTYGGSGTFAFATPGTLIAATLGDVAVGDVLELPGTEIKNVIFGTGSITVSTDKGIFDFTDVTFENQVNGYSASIDPVTGLEAITFGCPDTFIENDDNDAGEPYTGYPWSNSSNWSDGIPTNGDSVSENASGTDNLPNLSLSALTLTRPAGIDADTQLLTESDLSIARLTISNGAEIDAFGNNVTVSIGSITTVSLNDGGIPLLYADAPGAVIDVSSASGPQLEYIAQNGGRVEIDGVVNAASFLTYGGGGTFALPNAGTLIAATLAHIDTGDVLEITAASIENVIFGTSSLTIVTGNGNIDFSNVSYQGPVDGYTTSRDSATGLEAITFTGPDIFTDTTATLGEYLWSNASNWSQGVPGSFAQVDMADSGTDDIAGLSLSALTLTTPGSVDNDSVLFVKSGLSVSSLEIGNRSFIDVEGIGAANVLSVNQVTLVAGGANVFPTLEAQGAGAVIEDHGSFNPAVDYIADEGGVVELAGPPNASSALIYGGLGTFELYSPHAVNAGALDGVSAGDVLEIPKTVINNVIFGASSLTIVTGNGDIAFTNVSFASAVSGYTASLDSATGLEAITFNALDVFSDKSAQKTGPQKGQFLWSNAANWSQGVVPGNGAAVEVTGRGTDDIAGLSLSSLSFTGSELLVSDALAAGSLYVASGATVALDAPLNVSGSATVNGVITLDPTTAVLHGAVSGSGTFQVGAGDDLIFDGSVASGLAVDLLSPSGTLTINDPTAFSGTIVGHGTTISGGKTVTSAPPVITAPSSLAISAGLSTAISGIRLSEANAITGETFTIILEDAKGLLTATGTGISGSGSTALTLSGTLDAVNADLATLHDTDKVAGTDKIIITASDNLSGKAVPATIAVTAKATVSTAPVIVTSGHTVTNSIIGSGGSIFLEPGAAGNHVTIAAGGVLGVVPGATVSSTVVDGGVAGILGAAMGGEVNAGGYELIGLIGFSENVTVNQGGHEYVLFGGTAFNTTIATGGGMFIGEGGRAVGSIDFAGSEAVLSVAGSAMPSAVIDGFDKAGGVNDAIILTGFTYAAGHDSATLGSSGVLTLNLNGEIEKLKFNPAQSNAGHSYSITTNSLDQVVIIDPVTGTKPNMDFLAPATKAGSADVMSQILGRSAGLLLDFSTHAISSPGFQPGLKNFAAIDTLDGSAAASSLASLNLPKGLLSVISNLTTHPW